MNKLKKDNGSLLLMTIFAVALFSILIIGLLQVTTTDLQIARNHQHSLDAKYIAEAAIEWGLNQLKTNPNYSVTLTHVQWPAGSGKYASLQIINNNPSVRHLGRGQDLGATISKIISAEVTISGGGVPYSIQVDSWRDL